VFDILSISFGFLFLYFYILMLPFLNFSVFDSMYEQSYERFYKKYLTPAAASFCCCSDDTGVWTQSLALAKRT
jgi:hypothetical protein